jgi:hypothetical protein
MVLKNEAQIYESVNLQTEKNKYTGAWLHVNFMFLCENAFSAFILRPAGQIISRAGVLRNFQLEAPGFGGILFESDRPKQHRKPTLGMIKNLAPCVY